MSKIRIGLIGLSTTSASTSWASVAHLPYLQSPQGKKHFKIVALCNSSLTSAKKSIEHYKLDESTKTYDSAEKIARDPEVDLVVNVTGVEQHYGVLLPVVQAGKYVYTELPLAANMGQVKELCKVATEKEVKTIFGMQAQTSVVTKVLRDIIAEGKIGKILSTTWSGCNEGGFMSKPLPASAKQFVYRSTGANLMTVWFLHTFNHIIATLGPLSSYTSLTTNQKPTVEIMDPATQKVVETVQKDVPDHISLQGRLTSGATITYSLRGADPFPGQPPVVWEIYGEKGEIRITNPAMIAIDIVHAGVDIQLHVFGKEVEKVELPRDELEDVPHPARNVGKIYEAYARGRESGEGGYANWDDALKMHELMEDMFVKDGF